MAEWLRRQTRNLLGFPRVGSNPTDRVYFFYIFFFYFFYFLFLFLFLILFCLSSSYYFLSLLYGTTKGRLKVSSIQECDYTKEFICSDVCAFTFHESSSFKILHSQWFPYDSGMFCFVEPTGLHIFDSNKFDEILNTTIVDESCQSCDWNSVDPNVIASEYLLFTILLLLLLFKSLLFYFGLLICGFLVSTKSLRIKLFDLRTTNSLTTITVSGPAPHTNHEHNPNRSVTSIYWSPLDMHGLFVGDSVGDLFFYDTRHLKLPLGFRRADDHFLYLPVVHIEMVPDMKHLITAHCNSLGVTQWQFQPDKNEMLLNTNVNYQSVIRNGLKLKTKCFIKQTLFSTVDQVYSPNLFTIGPDLFCFDRNSGQRQLVHELSHNELRRPVLHVTGFRRTKYGDDPNPALVYTSSSQIVVSRMMTHAEPFDLVEEQNRCNERDRLQQDRWSDSD